MSQEQRSVLVTGATGFLGAQVLRRLMAGETVGRVVVATRGEIRPSRDDVCMPERVHMDLAHEVALPNGIDTVIHIAGEKRDESRMEAVNHFGTRRLVDAAARAGVRRFVYVSSVGVYGARPHSGLVNESFPHTPRNRYEASKEAGEACVRDVCTSAGMDFVILQPSNVIGFVKGQAYPLLGLMKMIRGGYFMWVGRTEPWVNYVAVEDVAAAIVAAIERAPAGHAYIINTPAPLAKVVGWIADELGVEQPHRRLPWWVGHASAAFGAMAARMSGRTMPINRERLLELTNTTQYDPSQLMQVAKFEYPIGVEGLIRGLVSTYRQEGLL
jgi:dihydroflavonol-4-reductase